MRVLFAFPYAAVAALTLGWCAHPLLARQAEDLSTLVMQFYPPALTALDLAVTGDLSPSVCYDVLARDAQGNPTTVLAGYGSRIGRGEARVLEVLPGGAFHVAWASPEAWDFSGHTCRVRRVMLATGVSEERVMSFDTERGSFDWIVQWNGAALVSLGPISGTTDSQTSDIRSARLWDVLNVGSPQVFSSSNPVKVYRRGTAGYIFEQQIQFVMEFVQDSDGVFVDWAGFDVATPNPGGYVLRVTNGRMGSVDRVSDAAIWLNEVPLTTASQINPNVEFLEIPIPDDLVTASDNQVKVQLSGLSGRRVVVVVAPAPQP
jgi:hypothetical protein